MNPRKAFEQALVKQADNKNWTLARRMSELYDEFKKQVEKKLVEMEPQSNKVKLFWVVRGHGFMWLQADFIDASGSKRSVTFLPETPDQAAGDILYKYGKY
jgi:hypothetical protein